MRNITLNKYARLRDTSAYDAILDYMLPKNEIIVKRSLLFPVKRVMNINKMPYANVKYAMRLLSKADSWGIIQQVFNICFDLSEEEFWKLTVKQFFPAKRYIISEFEKAAATENKMLSTQSTDEHLWDMAGAERLKPYSDTLPLVQLAKMFGQYPFDIGRKPYGEVFNLLIQIKTQNEVESAYQKLTTKTS